jgi:type II secretion system protein L
VLLRCVEPGRYVVDGERDAPPLTAVEVAARLRGRLTPQNAPDLHVLLPAARCLVTTLPVAKHEQKHLHSTLPWTLEERLLEPAEQMHCAHGPVVAGVASVAAINAAWLQQVLDDLRAAGLQPQSACSELFLLPWQAGLWSVYLPAASDAPVLVRHGAHAGFACARSNLHTALQLLLNEHGEAPRQVVVLAEAATQIDNAALFPVLLQARLVPQRQSAAQLMGAMTLPDCNLLQGRFAPALPWAAWWRQWRVAAALFAGLLLTDLALSAYQAFRLNRAAAGHEAAVIELYRSVQPDGVVVDPRLQLEQALAAVGAAGQEGFLSLLSRMAPALQATPDARVQNIEYDGTSGDLQLQVLTTDLAAENLRAQLRQQGLEAELLGSSNDSAGNRTRLRVGAGA